MFVHMFDLSMRYKIGCNIYTYHTPVIDDLNSHIQLLSHLFLVKRKSMSLIGLQGCLAFAMSPVSKGIFVQHIYSIAAVNGSLVGIQLMANDGFDVAVKPTDRRRPA